MDQASEDQVRRALAAVEEPELRRAVGELGMLRQVEVHRRRVEVVLAVPQARWPGLEELAARLEAALAAVPGAPRLSLRFEAMDEAARAELRAALARPAGGEPAPVLGPRTRPQAPPGGAPQPLVQQPGSPNRYLDPGSRTRVIGISSGKGGVGKSSVSVNLAVALAARGLDVGLLDADVYGFSVPKMLGVRRPPSQIDDLLVPPVVHGVRCLSIGAFVDDDQPVVWRGPMLHKALEQFLTEAYWGEPDVLLVDMPPGTGDVALSLGQVLPRLEVLVVTTPQPAAQRVAQRSAIAARTMKLAVRGVVENLSWFTADDGTRYELFGRGGGQQLADELKVPLLAQIPLVPAIREGADEGVPVRVAAPAGEAAQAFDALAEAVLALGPARRYRSELQVRT
ncbi:Mrp/NBP35 family ATP-binding protein [Aciditerrimonas ferrireducens]|uniref:Mrp/NBP35 family ATP-binding protein n=1 Tax=Aciditerrimonas ferrireducens TaxID=667306 RepID=UPI0020068926|nr:Mrp/NBP35 family ATP-binding protein [Aciditerrimonas ferrireducens]MCK4177653.1 Mrp/NBP35 family ATP-binding protein [Aciditerrimonas ferrireducens]